MENVNTLVNVAIGKGSDRHELLILIKKSDYDKFLGLIEKTKDAKDDDLKHKLLYTVSEPEQWCSLMFVDNKAVGCITLMAVQEYMSNYWTNDTHTLHEEDNKLILDLMYMQFSKVKFGEHTYNLARGMRR